MSKFIDGDVDLRNLKLAELPDLSDVTVIGSFLCSSNDLASLHNCPHKIDGLFSCGYNKKLKSLEFGLKSVGGDYRAHVCDLRTLEHIPRVINGDLELNNNPNLKSTRHFPESVAGVIYLSYCGLDELVDLPHEVKEIQLSGNKLRNFRGMPRRINRGLAMWNNPVDSLDGFPDYIGKTLSMTWSGKLSEKEVFARIRDKFGTGAYVRINQTEFAVG